MDSSNFSVMYEYAYLLISPNSSQTWLDNFINIFFWQSIFLFYTDWFFLKCATYLKVLWKHTVFFMSAFSISLECFTVPYNKDHKNIYVSGTSYIILLTHPNKTFICKDKYMKAGKIPKEIKLVAV